jgi:diphthine-ammonia ligase
MGENSTIRGGIAFFCSWSGGKDSALALYRAMSAGARPCFLFTMLDEGGKRSRSHGIPLEVLRGQAASLGIPLRTGRASWSEYESVFVAALRELAASGVEAGVFGDIDIDEHREWEEKVCEQAGLEAHLPLWKAAREELLEEFVGLGFEAVIIATNAEKMGREYLGKRLDRALIEELTSLAIDLCGEAGEYHTVVTDGPIFRERLRIRKRKAFLRSGYWFLDIDIGG